MFHIESLATHWKETKLDGLLQMYDEWMDVLIDGLTIKIGTETRDTFSSGSVVVGKCQLDGRGMKDFLTQNLIRILSCVSVAMANRPSKPPATRDFHCTLFMKWISAYVIYRCKER